MRILVTGASGLIGGPLSAVLRSAGHEVVPLARAGSPAAAEPGAPHWDPAAGSIDAARLEGFDAVVHLAGKNISGRFTAKHRREVLESRRDGTRLLAGALASLARPPRVLLSAAGTHVYGSRSEEILDETSAPGSGFLAEVVRVWEAETAPAAARGIRVVTLRSGLVLDARGGSLAPMVRATRLGAGGPLGGGRQWWSWIAIADWLRAAQHLLAADGLAGPVNLVAPDAIRQRDFARALGHVLHRPAILPAPAFALRLVLSRGMADELVLASQRVVPRRLLESGFRFEHADLETALRELLVHSGKIR